jgi:excisionase family DNA binding protein
MTDRERIPVNEAARRVGVTRTTIYKWIRAGKLEIVRTAGGSVRVYADTMFRPAGALSAGNDSTEADRIQATDAQQPDDRLGSSGALVAPARRGHR